MKNRIVEKKEMHFIGMHIRTSNASEMDPKTAKIGAAWECFFDLDTMSLIENKVAPEICGVYYNYESDEKGEYSLLIGCEVQPRTAPPNDLEVAYLPASKYLVFTAESGDPSEVIKGWQEIWQFFKDHPEYQRRFTGDFECHRARSPIEFYISIR